MKRITRAAVILSFICLLGGVSCQSGRVAKPRYIFLITLDTTRADHIDYTLGNQSTPHLAQLASQGICFPNAYALIPITLPSHASMFYSLSPHVLELYENGEILKTDLPSLAELLKKRGYASGAVISLGTVSKNSGIDKGFDHYISNFRRSYLWYKTAAEVNEDAIALIDRLKGKKTFFWIHYSDPHDPYFPPYYSQKGRFDIFRDGKIIFSSRSTERVSVKEELKISPGENIFSFKTSVSRRIKRNPQIKIRNITFENFSLTFNRTQGDVEVELPVHWKKVHTKKLVKHITTRRQSRIRIINKSGETLSAVLRFTYRMVPTLPSIRELYRQEVSYMDDQIGKLITYLKDNDLYDQSLFLIMGDHGEGLGEYRKHVGHIYYLNKLYTNVPLILCGKGILEKGRRQDIVSNLDVAPTLLDIARVKTPRFMRGRSLLKTQGADDLLLETYSPTDPGGAYAIIRYPYQIIFYPHRTEQRFEFINLESDQLGITNLMDSAIDAHSKRSLLLKIQQISEELIKNKVQKSEISDADKDMLRALGYIR